jgi:hypothetical protein
MTKPPDTSGDPLNRYTSSASIGLILGSIVAAVSAIFFAGLLVYVFACKRKQPDTEEGEEKGDRLFFHSVRPLIWARCYDSLNIFAEKIGVFDSKQS